MKNMHELRVELCGLFKSLKTKRVGIQTASEQNKTASNIIASTGKELEYFRLRKEKPLISFLASGRG